MGDSPNIGVRAWCSSAVSFGFAQVRTEAYPALVSPMLLRGWTIPVAPIPVRLESANARRCSWQDAHEKVPVTDIRAS